MQSIPEIRYARSGDVHIAFQSWGSGPALVGVPPFVQNIEALWADPTGLYPRFLQRFGDFATVTHFDKRGSGLSDRGSGFHSIEERIDDIRAVMDAVGLERASLGGISEGGPMAMMFAATYPERVDKLLLIGTGARFTQAPDYPHGLDAATFDLLTADAVDKWATPDSLLTPMWMPSLADDAGFRRWVTGYERASASPGAVRDAFAYIRDIDVRSVLSSISAPTLVIHRSDELIVDVAHGRYLAEHIEGAELVELAGFDHVPWVGDAEPVIAAAERFLTGKVGVSQVAERMLATVLFTDIVDSTRRATELGDATWRQLLDRHDRLIREEIERHGGTPVKSTGDGFLATFDIPSRGVRAAQTMMAATAEAGIPIRAGLHAGEIERRGDDIAGLAVHVAARVAAAAGAGEVLVSSTVRDLVLGGGFSLTDRGAHTLKGVDGTWVLLAVDAV
ncbi:MAG TPA: alpha/beta fold hydrolase [Mycobacteriales bacterium]|nr:alpha/beta fold hydrolase [Mycobacteriales bacterium]